MLIFQAAKNLVMWKCIWQARAKKAAFCSVWYCRRVGTWHLWSPLLIWLQRVIKKMGTSFNCRGNFSSSRKELVTYQLWMDISKGVFFFFFMVLFSFIIFSLRQPRPFWVKEGDAQRWILTLHIFLSWNNINCKKLVH